MKKTAAVGMALLVCAALPAQTPAAPPAWAYGVPASPAPPQPQDDGLPKHLEGSTQAFTIAQIRDGFTIADWFPGDHPTPPAIVLNGRRPDARACGLCHYPNGKGRPDFRDGNRKSAETRKTNTNIMSAIAKAMTDEEMKETAVYFGSMTSSPWISVVEAATVPKTRLASGMFTPLDGAETEPIGARIIEMPQHPDRTELRDPRSGFVAYVPVGSIKKGEALVETGGADRTIRCGVCHGADLTGLGPVPGIAGRSPSYQVRQLFDMQAGTRKGVWTPLMKAVVANLTQEDRLAIAAYTASRGAR